MENAVEIVGLSKSFGKFSLEDVNLSIPKGCIVGLIGSNGAGKTTLMKCMTGANMVDSGELRFSGEQYPGYAGIVLDECHFPQNLNAKQMSNVLSGLFSDWDPEKFEEMIVSYGIDMNLQIRKYSRGMSMNLQVAVALCHRTEILILDEPTAGLDPAARDEFLDVIMEYMQDEEHTVLMSSHITSDLEKIADYIAFIQDGRIVMFDEKDSILDRYGIAKVGNDSVDSIDRESIVCVRHNDFGTSILVNDKNGMREAYPEMVIDNATLEEIFVFMMRGDAA